MCSVLLLLLLFVMIIIIPIIYLHTVFSKRRGRRSVKIIVAKNGFVLIIVLINIAFILVK